MCSSIVIRKRFKKEEKMKLIIKEIMIISKLEKYFDNLHNFMKAYPDKYEVHKKATDIRARLDSN